MAGGPLNSDAGTPDSLFGVLIPKSTGAGGSAGVSAGTDVGPVVGSPVVSIQGASFQVAAFMPVFPVHSGDTSSFSDDQPVHQSPLLPDAAGASMTGAGSGTGEHVPHPNAAGRP